MLHGSIIFSDFLARVLDVRDEKKYMYRKHVSNLGQTRQHTPTEHSLYSLINN